MSWLQLLLPYQPTSPSSPPELAPQGKVSWGLGTLMAAWPKTPLEFQKIWGGKAWKSASWTAANVTGVGSHMCLQDTPHKELACTLLHRTEGSRSQVLIICTLDFWPDNGGTR